jgi:hypothetical protein|tara:strand:+ start:251 stop:1183 length:933 start_codon:yes stop_codon:yes gene_type:complete
MAGILDGKQRVMDTIITIEGRRQMAEGDLRIHFATFTDRHTFYQASGSDGVAEDPADRIYLEATNMLQDQIIFETDDNARMLSYRGGSVATRGNGILSASAGLYLQPVTGSAVLGATDALLSDAADSFANQYVISTKETFSETQGFDLSTSSLKFRLTDNMPLRKDDITKASIDNVESLYADARLSHLPNFQYLPPVNKSAIGMEMGSPLGDYEKLNQLERLSFQDLMSGLRGKEDHTVSFTETSRENNLIAQMMETSPRGLEKLSVIDFGEFPDEEPLSPGKRVFFAGKIFTDNNGSHTFVNMFTIIFD